MVVGKWIMWFKGIKVGQFQLKTVCLPARAAIDYGGTEEALDQRTPSTWPHRQV